MQEFARAIWTLALSLFSTKMAEMPNEMVRVQGVEQAVLVINMGYPAVRMGYIYDGDDVSEFAKAVIQSKTLVKLDMIDGHINDDRIKAFAPAVAEGNLQELKMCYNYLFTEDIPVLAEALGKSKLRKFTYVSNNKFTDECAEAFGAAVAKSQALDTFRLEGVQLTTRGVKALAEGVGKSKTLRSVALWTQWGGAEGAEALAEAVERSTSLEELELSGGSLGHEGIKALTKAAAKLKVLKLISCEVTDADMGVLVQAVPSLLELHLGWRNKITAAGVATLAKALVGSSLQVINLEHIVFGFEGARRLAEAVRRTPSLLKVKTSYPAIILPALEEAKQRRAVGAFTAGALAEATPRTNSARRFLDRDGDHAVMERVFAFLV